MHVSFVTPSGALVVLVGLVPLGVLVLGRSRLKTLCTQLGLRPPEGRSMISGAVALVALSVLLGLAAAQPVLATHSSLAGRDDAAAFFVFDVSRSMSARMAPRAPTRLDRARQDAKNLRTRLPGLPVGVASITDRLLPHLFPSVSVNAFNATLDESLAIDRPTSSLPYGNALGTRIGALQDLELGHYFETRAKKRVAVVFTDGETLPNDLSTLPGFLRDGDIRLVFLRYWRPTERIYDNRGHLDQAYVPDLTSEATFDDAARTLSAPVLAPGQARRAAADVKRIVGDGPSATRQRELDSLLLTPYVLLAALVPLAFLVARRDVRSWLSRLRAARGRVSQTGA